MADKDNNEGLSSETLLEMLRRLPPSKELLDFYHQKVQAFARSVLKDLPRSFYLSSKHQDLSVDIRI